MSKKLTKEFFERDSRKVARDLIGKALVRETDKKTVLSGIILQVDAYSLKDFIENKRNKGALYPTGAIHMYPSQGKYSLAISTLDAGGYNEILIRQVQPLSGIEQMMVYRNTRDEKILTNGPSKVVQAFGLDKDFDSRFITDPVWGLYIEGCLKDPKVKAERVVEDDSASSSDFVGRYTLKG